jgi:hypothetical protein
MYARMLAAKSTTTGKPRNRAMVRLGNLTKSAKKPKRMMIPDSMIMFHVLQELSSKPRRASISERLICEVGFRLVREDALAGADDDVLAGGLAPEVLSFELLSTLTGLPAPGAGG